MTIRVVMHHLRSRSNLGCLGLLLALFLGAVAAPLSNDAAGQSAVLRFAVIGDFGVADTPTAEVAALVQSWLPDLVITVGDNNYPDGSASTIDDNIGQFYHQFISPYRGTYGPGAATNKFFPSLGNHDWETTGAKPYLDYFTLPGNERYYDFVRGPVQFFALDSDPREPDGITATSRQGTWLQNTLAASKSRWRLVYFHHAAYSSGDHGNTADMQWPFGSWGATVVLAGHDHDYERIHVDGLPYFVNGAGGNRLYDFHTPVAGSRVRYNADQGAMLVEASDRTIVYRFINRKGKLIDSYVQCVSGPGGHASRPCQVPGTGGRNR
jgi:tartrate-resistant acid phosphatase type 5